MVQQLEMGLPLRVLRGIRYRAEMRGTHLTWYY